MKLTRMYNGPIQTISQQMGSKLHLLHFALTDYIKPFIPGIMFLYIKGFLAFVIK